MKVKQKGNLISAFWVYCAITCIVYILPAAKFRVPYIYAALLMLAGVLFALLKVDGQIEKVATLIVFSGIYALIAWGAGKEPLEAMNEGIRNIRFFLPVFWGIYTLRYCSRKQKILFLLFISCLAVFILLKTTSALASDPWLARILAQDKSSSSDEINRYRLQNIGGFEFSYMMGIVTLCLADFTLKTKKTLLKLISIVALIVCFDYIISTMYTTLLLLVSLGVFILFFLNIKDEFARIILFIVGICLLFFLGDIFQLLSTVFPQKSLLSVKFQNLYLAISQNNMGALGSRPQLILDSLSKWIRNPIFGRYDVDSNSHSLIIGILEQTGIVGLSIVGSLFYSVTKYMLQEMKKKRLPIHLFKVSIIYLLLLALFNPIGYVFEVTIAVYFIVPLCTEIFYKAGDI